MSKERYRFSDFLRGIAVLMMIQVHVTEILGNSTYENSLLGKISLFFGSLPAAPIFLMIMGFFVERTTKTQIKILFRGFRLFVGGILLNIFLNLLLLYDICFENYEADPLAYIFGADILPFAGISLLFIGLVKNILQKSPWNIILLIIFFLIVNSLNLEQISDNFFPQYVSPFILSEKEWSYFPFIPWIVWILTGYVFSVFLKKYNLNFTDKRIRMMLYFSFFITILGFYWFVPSTYNLHEYYHFSSLFYFWGLAFLIQWTVLFYAIYQRVINLNITKFIEYTGKKVTMFYVVQWIIIGNFGNLFYKEFDFLECVVLFFAIIFVSWIVVKLLDLFGRKLSLSNVI